MFKVHLPFPLASKSYMNILGTNMRWVPEFFYPVACGFFVDLKQKHLSVLEYMLISLCFLGKRTCISHANALDIVPSSAVDR